MFDYLAAMLSCVTTTSPDSRLPVLYLSHGAPPLADDATWTAELAAWSAALPRPQSILMVSAHWEEAPLALSATTPVPLVYDFWGFPQRYYDVTYDAPGAPELAADVAALVRGPDTPVLQMSMPTLDPQRLFEIGRSLAPLRDQGTLIVGSGFTTHNLAWFNPAAGSDSRPPQASAEFDNWAAEALERQDIDAILDFMNKAPAAHEAHPRTERRCTSRWGPRRVLGHSTTRA